MKEIGTTHDGEYLIQVNEVEHRVLEDLQAFYACRDMRWAHPVPLKKDMSDAFLAIRAWVSARDRIEDLRVTVDNLEGIFTSPEKQDECCSE